MERLRGRPRAELAGPRRILRRSQGPRGIEGNRETDAGTRGEDRGLAGELDRQTDARGRERAREKGKQEIRKRMRSCRSINNTGRQTRHGNRIKLTQITSKATPAIGDHQRAPSSDLR